MCNFGSQCSCDKTHLAESDLRGTGGEMMNDGAGARATEGGVPPQLQAVVNPASWQGKIEAADRAVQSVWAPGKIACVRPVAADLHPARPVLRAHARHGGAERLPGPAHGGAPVQDDPGSCRYHAHPELLADRPREGGREGRREGTASQTFRRRRTRLGSPPPRPPPSRHPCRCTGRAT